MKVAMDSPWSQVFGFAALDHVPVGSCVLNSQLEVVFWNKVLETWTGINRWDILHHEISEFFPHLYQPQYRLRLDEIFQGGPPLVLSSQLHGQIFPSTCQDGQVRLQHTTVTSIPTHDGNGCLACFAVEDVSVVARRIADLRSTRDKAEKLADEARHANEAKSQFLANMSHELRTPLNSILLLSGMMVEDAKNSLSEADRYSAQIIHNSGDALLELVNDILDLSKVEAGKRDLEIEKTDLATFLHDIEDSIALLITHQGLEFKMETGAEVPATFVTDTRALTQITRNLLSNAAKFTKKGQVTLKLAVAAPDWLDLEDKQDQWLSVSVSDTGPGIAADRQEAIFEPFCQEDGTISREFGGTGLGLSISRQLAEQLGGRLLLDSRLNEGSTFTLFLPSHSSSPESNGAALDYSPRNMAPEIRPKDISGFRKIVDQAVTDWETAESLAPDSLSGYKILVTDDDMRSLFTISGILERGGAEVLSAASGKDALAKLSNNPDVNLLLIDMSMPEMNVPETLEKIRGQLDRSDVPMICMTGQQEDHGCQGCGHCLAKLTLTKPFPHKELVGQIEQLLSQPITLA